MARLKAQCVTKARPRHVSRVRTQCVTRDSQSLACKQSQDLVFDRNSSCLLEIRAQAVMRVSFQSM